MGKKLNALLGRGFKAYKLRALVNLSFSRLAILKQQRQARCSLARSDVTELLKLGYHDRALYRVEQVIKEQNMLDVLAMIEGYCSHVMERISLIQEEKECPDELKEAVSSLIYASSRTGEFPELKEMRTVFTARFGKEFTAQSIELRNNCSVNIRMIQKLSTRQPSYETRLEALKEIATQNGVELRLEEYDLTAAKVQPEKKHLFPNSDIEADIAISMEGNLVRKKKYTDVADAAEAAFQSAAYAAEAAKAAVELSRPRPHTDDGDDQNRKKHDDRTEILTVDDKNKSAAAGGNISVDDKKSDNTTDEEVKERKRPKSVRTKRRQ